MTQPAGRAANDSQPNTDDSFEFALPESEAGQVHFRRSGIDPPQKILAERFGVSSRRLAGGRRGAMEPQGRAGHPGQDKSD